MWFSMARQTNKREAKRVPLLVQLLAFRARLFDGLRGRLSPAGQHKPASCFDLAVMALVDTAGKDADFGVRIAGFSNLASAHRSLGAHRGVGLGGRPRLSNSKH
jgi:hypothetical protein